MTPVQRRQQIGRIHQAKHAMHLGETEYRQLLQSLTGCTSCTELDDRGVNHVLDWLNYLSGHRARQPISFDRLGRDPHANLVSVCYAIRDIVPPGYQVNPIRSMDWQTRTAGRCAAFFEDFKTHELWRLIEGVKVIFARAGTRFHSETLAGRALSSEPLPQNPPISEPSVSTRTGTDPPF